MYCNQCGSRLPDGARVCSVCGTAVTTAAAAPVSAAGPAAAGAAFAMAAGRIERHRTILGVLWIVDAVLAIPGGFFLMGIGRALPFMMHGGAPPPWIHMWPFVSGFMGVLGGFLLVLAVLHLAAGIGLLQRQSWARMLTLVVGFISLLSFPLGTLLGIYTIWVLISAEAGQVWARISQP